MGIKSPWMATATPPPIVTKHHNHRLLSQEREFLITNSILPWINSSNIASQLHAGFSSEERLAEEFVSNRLASRTRSIWIRGDSTSSSTNDTSAHTRCDQKDEQNVVWPSSRHDIWKTCSDSESLSISGGSGVRDNERICLEVIASGKKIVDFLLSRQGLCSTFLDFEEDAYIEAERGTISQGIRDQVYCGTDTHLSSACPMWVYMFGWKCNLCCVVKRSKTADKHYHFVAHEVPMVYGLIICRLESWFPDHFVDKGLHALQNGPG